MPHVLIASLNHVKINAAELAFTAMFPDTAFTFAGCDAPSGVPEQPMGSDQTKRGALNRLTAIRTAVPNADYWIAFEGGVEETGTADAPCMTSVIWVATTDLETGYISTSRCVTFEIPPPIAALIRGGMTLGDADDRVFNRTNSKQQNGAIGIVTHDVLTRTSVYHDGAVMSLVPFVNHALYFQTNKQVAA
jgi:inosine/xanthosine triphosphatase